MLVVGLTEILPGVREILQLSFFLHNSNFFRQPSSLRVQRREQMDSKTGNFVCKDRTSKATFAAVENSWSLGASYISRQLKRRPWAVCRWAGLLELELGGDPRAHQPREAQFR